MQRKTLFIVVIIVIIAFGIWLLTYVQKMAKIPVLLDEMGDSDFEIAGDAMDDLAKYGPKVADDLGVVVRGVAEDPIKRARAAQVLGIIGSRNQKAVQALIAALDDSPRGSDEDSIAKWQENDEVRWNAAVALGRIGASEAIPVLEEHMTNPKESEIVRISCVRALALLGSEQSVTKMVAILNDRPPFPEEEEETEETEEATPAEGEAAEPEEAEEEEVPGESAALRIAVCEALAMLGRKGGPEVSALMDAATREGLTITPAIEPDLGVAQWACYALGDIGDPKAKDVLTANLKDVWVDVNEDDIDDDTDANVRIAAAYALGRLGDKSVMPSLQTSLADKEYWVRGAALKSIEELGGKLPKGKYAAPIQ